MIDEIIKNQLCIGCGLCSSVLSHEKCEMKLSDDGFYAPICSFDVDDKIVKTLCPGIRVKGDGHQGIWGTVMSVKEGWSNNTTLRHKAASGGVTSSIAIYLIESHAVDAVLHVGVCNDSYLYNELKVSRSSEDIIQNAQSRYAPALSLYNIKQLLDSTDDKFAFIGKPCDIAGIKNLIEMFPQYRDRFILLISIFCAGMPSYNATIKTWRMSGHKDEPIALKYRGDGWPGEFCAKWTDGTDYKLSYNESWGKILGRSLGYRCKICPDGIGLLADIAVGDSWNTKDGYPDFTDDDGRNFIFIRTKRGLDAIRNAQQEGIIECRDIPIDKIKDMQPYQYGRRMLVGWRLLPIKVCSLRLLSFTGLSIWSNAKKAGLKEGVLNLTGSIKRLLRKK